MASLEAVALAPEEDASVFADAFSQLCRREASFDPSVLDDLPQRGRSPLS